MTAIPTPAPVQGDINWFVHDRFGMFIHWGLYALPARHEWVKNREAILDEKYDKYLRYFDPDCMIPRMSAAHRQAGMKYVVVPPAPRGLLPLGLQFTDYKPPTRLARP